MSDDLEALVRDLGKIPAAVVPKVRGVVSKGALNIKNQLKREASSSRSFGRMAKTIDYDIESGNGRFAAEIGPNKGIMTGRKVASRYGASSSPGSAASLAGIAYFGGSRGGGNTLPDPAIALADEAPKFIEALEKLAGDVL